jgi:hypothetical protein
MICEVVKYAFETLHGKFAVIDSVVFAAGILFSRRCVHSQSD